jgi:putative PIN family toxin of toxin-antitoxin system
MCLTTDIWQEYDSIIVEVMRREQRQVDVQKVLTQLLKIAHFVEPAPLGKRRSRDPKDDIYLAAALGAQAEVTISNDRDLLILGTPFGIHVCTPMEFLKRVRSQNL